MASALTGGKRKKADSVASSMQEARQKISEPIVDLISSCSYAATLFPDSDLYKNLEKLRFRVSKLLCCEKFLLHGDDRLPSALCLSLLFDSLLGTCKLRNGEEDQKLAFSMLSLRSKSVKELLSIAEESFGATKRLKKDSSKGKENSAGGHSELNQTSKEKIKICVNTVLDECGSSFSVDYIIEYLNVHNKAQVSQNFILNFSFI